MTFNLYPIHLADTCSSLSLDRTLLPFWGPRPQSSEDEASSRVRKREELCWTRTDKAAAQGGRGNMLNGGPLHFFFELCWTLAETLNAMMQK